MTRRSITKPNAFIPPPESKANRTRTWEKSNPGATYRIPSELRQQITDLSTDLSVTTSDLVEYLLLYALAHLDKSALLEAREWRPGKARMTKIKIK